MSKPDIQPRSTVAPPMRILIADDVAETRRSTRLMLSLIPETKVVAFAHNGREAIEMARLHQPDIALMDVNMPEMDGLSAIERMLKRQPALACIVISSEQDRTTLQRAMRVGAQDYLIKPFTSDQLTQVIQRVRKIVLMNQQKYAKTAVLSPQEKRNLSRKAIQVIKSRRTDDEAKAVLEALAADPDCEQRWLMGLTLLYVYRRDWGKLRRLAARLEKSQMEAR